MSNPNFATPSSTAEIGVNLTAGTVADDDASLLNQILRVTWAASTFTPIVDPVQSSPFENDHFIEVQHFTTVLIEILKQRDQYANWYKLSIGYFLDLSTFVNERRNLFRISKAMNQAKKNIRLENYKNDANIKKYLAFKVIDPKTNKSVTVKDSVSALLKEMSARGSVGGNQPFGDLARDVGKRMLQILGW